MTRTIFPCPIGNLRVIALTFAALLTGCASPPGVEHVGAVPTGGAVIPLTLLHNMPVVDLHTQRRTLRLIVDLGGTDALALTKSTLRDLNVRWTGGNTWVADAFGTLHRSREFILPDASLGGLDLHGVHGYEVHDGRVLLPGPPGDPPLQLDGYVGLDLLRLFNVLVDYPNDRLVLADPQAPLPVDITHWATSPFDLSRVGITSRFTAAGRSMDVVWDTGANWTCIRPASVPPDQPRRTRGREQAVKLSSVIIGGRDVGPLTAVILDFRQPNVDLIVGTNLFRECAAWFDFTQRRLAVQPRSEE